MNSILKHILTMKSFSHIMFEFVIGNKIDERQSMIYNYNIIWDAGL